MALIRYGGGIVQMSGSIAGNTFARNRFGNYCRTRTKPTNPQSARQTEIRSYVAELVERWAETLTAAQRTAWGDYSNSISMKNKLGENIKLSGFNHYIRSNVWLLDLGGTLVDAAPTTLTLPDKDGTIAVTATAATQKLSVSFNDSLAWVNEDEAYLVMVQGSPQNPQRNFFNGPWRGQINIAGDGTTPPTTPTELDTIWVIAEGQKTWLRYRILRADGRLSEPWISSCIVAA